MQNTKHNHHDPSVQRHGDRRWYLPEVRGILIHETDTQQKAHPDQMSG